MKLQVSLRSAFVDIFIFQQVRRYATGPPTSGGGSNIMWGGVAAAVLGGGYYAMYGFGKPGQHSVPHQASAHADSKASEPVKCFTGGDQGFISLVLDNVETINHNTKRFRFKLPDENSVSGLTVASALITKYKSPQMEKPAIRPYTPVSDEGTPGTGPSLDIAELTEW